MGWLDHVRDVLGAIIAPGVALAAFSDIRIVGATGAPAAQVTPANQLRTADIDPARLTGWHGTAIGGNPCVSEAVPAGNSALLRQIVLDVYANASPTNSDTVYVFATMFCGGNPIASFTPSARETMVIPFDPGVPLVNGNGFSLFVADTGLAVEYHALGYTMPPGAVPATFTPLGSKGTSKKQR